MEISRPALGIIGAICLALGAGGAYLANQTDRREPGGPLAVVDGRDAGMPVAVEQSETIIRREPAAEPIPPAASSARRPRAAAPAAPTRRVTRDEPPTRPTPAPEATPEPTPPAETPRAVPPAIQPYREEPDTADVVEPPAPEIEELIVATDSVIGLQVDTSLTSERARVEDAVMAHVTRDVRVGDRVAIPAGARAEGEVTLVERGGRLRERARLGIRFTSIVLADGTRVPIDTETVYREGDSPGNESRAKIGGGAIAGAILGGILGGARGAVLGGSAGAGAGTAAVLAGGRNAATLTSGTPLTVRLLAPAAVTVER